MIPFSFFDVIGLGWGNIVLTFRTSCITVYLRFSLLLEFLSSKVRAILNGLIISYSSEEPPEEGPHETGGISITVDSLPDLPG